MKTTILSVLLLTTLLCRPAFCGEIHDAAKKGDLEKVKVLLKDNPDLVNSKETNGWTPLHWAAIQGQTNVAALLLANKADVNATNNYGWMPLQLALLSRHKEVTELLCKAAPATQLGDMKHDVTGVWKLSAEILATGTVVAPNGNGSGQMLLTQNPELTYNLHLVQFKSKITGNGHVNGSIDGSKLILTIPSDSFGDIIYEGDIVDAESMKGTLRFPGGKTGTWHAKRDLGD